MPKKRRKPNWECVVEDCREVRVSELDVMMRTKRCAAHDRAMREVWRNRKYGDSGLALARREGRID